MPTKNKKTKTIISFYLGRSFASRGRATLVGECGDGKSSLLNKIRDPNRSGQAASGLRSRGVTKETKAYVGMPIAGREIDYFDTPGDGDMDVTPMDIWRSLNRS